MSIITCDVKKWHIVCPECGRSNPDVCKREEDAQVEPDTERQERDYALLESRQQEVPPPPIAFKVGRPRKPR